MKRKLTGFLVGMQMASSLLAAQTIIKNVNIFNGTDNKLYKNHTVVVEGNKIFKITEGSIKAEKDDTVIDGKGQTLMPGLIDMHTHIALAGGVNAHREEIDSQTTGALAYRQMNDDFLDRGFTTIRDIGGASLGLARAVEKGQIRGPRILSAGAVIGPTSGHGDWSNITDEWENVGATTMEKMGHTLTVNGRDEMLKAARFNFKKGAVYLKLMANGGIVSDFDPLNSVAFTPDEFKAAVEAANDFGTYVAVHAYTDDGINRALDAGVKVIEHGFLASEKTIKRMAKEGAYFSWQAYVSLVTLGQGKDIPGFSAENVRKANIIHASAQKVVKWVDKYKVKVIGGSDIYLGDSTKLIMNDVTIKQKYVTPYQALKMHTSTAGEVLAMSGYKNPYRFHKLGVIEKDAYADLLLVKGNPLEDLKVLLPKENMTMIMKDGKFIKKDGKVIKKYNY